jgi:multiple sugar transport system permease protein
LDTQLVSSTAKPSISESFRAASKKLERRTALTFWGFVAPLVIGLIIFVYIPILWGLGLSFFQARATITPQAFVGLDNYTSLLNDVEFTSSLKTVAVFAIFIVPTTVAFSLTLALLVNSIKYGKGFFRSVFFVPTACSYVVASLIWRMSIFTGLPSGPANQIVMNLFDSARIAWIGTTVPPWYWLVLVTVRLWLQVGFYMIILLAGLQEIPKELYEAARVDGASTGWQTFRHITIPGLRNALTSVVLLNLIAAFQAFDEFYNILGGTAASSGNSTLARPPLVYLYQVGFSNQNYGRGSAGAFILTIIIIAVTIFQGRLFGFGKVEKS